MWRYAAAALSMALCFGAAPARAQGCAPNCDFYHDYGPYKVGPELYCYPQCDAFGTCSPFPVCRRQAPVGTASPAAANACLPDLSRCRSNYDCCSQSCGWSEQARGYLCAAGGFLSLGHPPSR